MWLENPQNITPRYCSTFPIWYCPEPLTGDFDMHLCVLGNECLLPITGKDLMNGFPENLDYGFHPYLITFGARNNMVGYKLIVPQSRKQPAWYIFSFKTKKQILEFTEKRPAFFEWRENYFRKYQDQW
jgi:hypothetical protein